MEETKRPVYLSANGPNAQEGTLSKVTSLHVMMPESIAPNREIATALQADSLGVKNTQETTHSPSPTLWSRLNPLNIHLTPIPEPSKVPDGGLEAWLQVLMGHLVCFNAWGYINSYGLFETYYLANIPHTNASNLAWVSSIQACLLSLIGAFSGFFHDTGYFYSSVTAGLFLQLLGTFTTSACTQYWQIMLAQGVCQGLGNGLLFCPAMSVISTYFSRKRSVAIALAAGGSATGGVVYPVIAMQLMDKIGFGWTVRVMGFVQLFNSILILLLARPRLPSKAFSISRVLDFTVFKELSYSLFAIGCFLTLWSLYYAFTYINLYASSILGLSPSSSLILLLITSGIGLPGRIAPAILADRLLGPLQTLIPLTMLCGLMFFLWITVKSLTAYYAFVVFFGLINAGVQGIFLAATSSTTTDMSKIGTRIGMILGAVSFAILTGGPIAGALIDRMDGRFLGAQVFGGSVMMCGSAFFVAARIAKTGFVRRVKL